MILSILVTRKKGSRLEKTTAILIGIAVFFVLFTWVYERFSFGESSIYMRGMFLIPLGSAALFGIRAHWLVGTWGRRLWLFSAAVFVSGCLIKGIIEVSGRSTDVEQLYWIAGSILLIGSMLIGLYEKRKQNKD